MKILFTSVGRRVELMQAFRAAAERLHVPLQIWGADVTDTAPALLFCDRTFQVCRIREPEYIPQLLALCEREHIDALIPTIDTDLLILSQNRERFRHIGTRVIVSGEESIRICRDKRLTERFFLDCGLHAPVTVDDVAAYSAGYPCFIKPKDGSSSVNAFRIDSREALRERAEQVEDYIIQPFIEGEEYTVDILCDFDGTPILITPRIRMAVRSGEVLKTRIVSDARIDAECRALVRRFKPCGAITVQLIRQRSTGEDFFIEINPRFGGGAPLSMKAGADSAAVLIRLLDGDERAYDALPVASGAVYSRFDQCICAGGGRLPVRVAVFDLDDTLYAEKAYVRSGFTAVARLLPQLVDAQAQLWAAFEQGKPAIDTVLADAGIDDAALREACIRAYRDHEPEISLYADAAQILSELRARGIRIGILTDGRPGGQRAKIRALGLEQLADEIIVTDELGGAAFRKPNDVAFRVMQRRMNEPFERMVYIGDNPLKDFIAPRQLGMQTIWFRNPESLYSARGDAVVDDVVTSLPELRELLL